MDFHDTPEEAAFREELRDWLSVHLVGMFRNYLGVGGAADDSHWQVRLEWEKQLARDRWLNISWPVAYGGRGGTLNQAIISYLELARARAPYWVGIQAVTCSGPRCCTSGRPSRKRVSCRGSRPARKCGAKGSVSRTPAATSPHCAHAGSSTATSGSSTGRKVWNTFGQYADWIYVLCRTGDATVLRHRGISMLLVRRDQAGVDDCARRGCTV